MTRPAGKSRRISSPNPIEASVSAKLRAAQCRFSRYNDDEKHESKDERHAKILFQKISEL